MGGDAKATSLTGDQLPFERVLVTGAHGFVGRKLVPALRARLAKDARLVLTSRDGVNASSGLPLNNLDITDPVAVGALVRVERPDLVIHLAGQASAAAAGRGGGECWAVNCVGTLNIAMQLAANDASCLFVLASTTDVYGQAFAEGRVTEKTRPEPISPYGRSKLASEALLGDVLPPSVRSIVARATNHSGAGQDRRFVLPSIAAQIVAGKMGRRDSIEVGNLSIRRDFLSVDDVVDAYLALIETNDAGDLRFTVNLASGTLVSIEELLRRMQAIAESCLPYSTIPSLTRANDIDRTDIDTSLIASRTGWAPTRTLDYMLAQVLEDQWSLAQSATDQVGA